MAWQKELSQKCGFHREIARSKQNLFNKTFCKDEGEMGLQPIFARLSQVFYYHYHNSVATGSEWRKPTPSLGLSNRLFSKRLYFPNTIGSAYKLENPHRLFAGKTIMT